MKKFIPTLLILIVACENKPKTETLTGDLYFSFFRLGSNYNQSTVLLTDTRRLTVRQESSQGSGESMTTNEDCTMLPAAKFYK